MELDITVTTLPRHPFDTAPHSELGYGEVEMEHEAAKMPVLFQEGRLLSSGISPPAVPNHLMSTP